VSISAKTDICGPIEYNSAGDGHEVKKEEEVGQEVDEGEEEDEGEEDEDLDYYEPEERSADSDYDHVNYALVIDEPDPWFDREESPSSGWVEEQFQLEDHEDSYDLSMEEMEEANDNPFNGLSHDDAYALRELPILDHQVIECTHKCPFVQFSRPCTAELASACLYFADQVPYQHISDVDYHVVLVLSSDCTASRVFIVSFIIRNRSHCLLLVPYAPNFWATVWCPGLGRPAMPSANSEPRPPHRKKRNAIGRTAGECQNHDLGLCIDRVDIAYYGSSRD